MSEILLPRLYERDIDVLLQEELIFNQALCALLGESLRFHGLLRIHQCRLSVVDQTGETDLFAMFSSDTRQGVLLIENKIDAGFQPRQPERYRERATSLAAEAGVDWVFCILVAPRRYVRDGLEGINQFDAIVAYEDVASAVAKEGTPRSRHRAAMLLQTVEHARSSYVLTPVVEVGNLWNRIYEIADREFPDLKMAVPSRKGSQSKWMIFKAKLPSRITIDWKITKATVDLSFWKGAVHRPIQSINLSPLPGGATLEQLGDTIAIRVPVMRPPAEWTEMTDDQIRAALTAALELLRFYENNSASFA